MKCDAEADNNINMLCEANIVCNWKVTNMAVMRNFEFTSE